MSDGRTIREAIQHLAGTHGNNPLFIADAEIVDVDIPSRTCTVTIVDGDAAVTRDDVRLMSVVDDGILFFPTVGSTVTIIYSTFTAPVVIGYSGIDLITLRGGDLGGLVILGECLKALNAVQNDVNKLKQAVNDWVVVPNDGGAGLKASSAGWAGSELEVTQKKNLENTAITQG